MIPSTLIFLSIFVVLWMVTSTIVTSRNGLKQKANKKIILFEQEYNARLEALQVRVTEMERYEQARMKRRIMELSEKPTPTLAERRELAWMKAEQSDHGVCSTSTHLESPFILWDREQHASSSSIQPYLTADWATTEKHGITAITGTAFHLLTSPIFGQPFRRVSYVLVRINQSCPWERLAIAHVVGESIQDIIHRHLQKKFIIPMEALASPGSEGMRWDPETNEWYIPEYN